MLNEKIALDVINEALKLGASFCDLFIEKVHYQSSNLKNMDIEKVESGINFGIGVRLIYGTQALYAYTNDPSHSSLIKLVRQLSSQYKTYVCTDPLEFFTASAITDVKTYPSTKRELAERLKKLQDFARITLDRSPLLTNVSSMLTERRQEVEIYNSHGLYAKDLRPYTRLWSSVIAEDENDQISAHYSPGILGGDTFLDEIDYDAESKKLATRALTILKAKPCPAGNFPVVIDNAFGGVIFHEACGHLLETTSVEKKASVLWDKKGEKIAHEAVSAYDDGTIDRLWGSINIDDEGMPTQRTTLIEKGILKNFISDYVGELKTGHERTGSARRESYKFAPASRMRNTFIAPGDYEFADLIKSMDRGIYAKSMGGGSVNPATGEFNFAVEEGYLVENGEIKEAVKGATLIGKGEDILPKISMCSKDLDYAAGMCGSVSGSVPVTVGQPAIKVDDILVGGKA